MSFSKHSAVISAFGKEFVKTGLLPSELHRYLLDAFRDRIKGDYEITSLITQKRCRETLKRAEEFLRETKKFLRIE